MSKASITAEVGAQIVAWARTQVDVPWVHQGRVPGEGLDCVGLPVCAARHVGFSGVADMLQYSETPLATQLLECVMKNCVPAYDDQPGDLWLMWVRRELEPQHAVIWTGEGTIIHAKRMLGKGSVKEERVDERWSHHFHSRWRLRAW